MSGIEGVGHQAVSLPQPVHEPLGIESWYVGAAAGADNHFIPLYQAGESKEKLTGVKVLLIRNDFKRFSASIIRMISKDLFLLNSIAGIIRWNKTIYLKGILTHFNSYLPMPDTVYFLFYIFSSSFF